MSRLSISVTKLDLTRLLRNISKDANSKFVQSGAARLKRKTEKEKQT